MHCDEFEDRLNALLDLRQSPSVDGELAAHASDCPTCQATWRALSAVADALANGPRPAPSADLARRVLAEIASGEPREPADRQSSIGPRGGRAGPSRRIVQAALMALAAGLLVAVGLALWPRDGNRPDATNVPVAIDQRPGDNDSDNTSHPAIPVDARPVDAGPRDDLRTTLADAWLLAQVSPTPEAGSIDERAAASQWGDELASGLRPLADSTAEAFSFLMIALPDDPANPSTPGTQPPGTLAPEPATRDDAT